MFHKAIAAAGVLAALTGTGAFGQAAHTGPGGTPSAADKKFMKTAAQGGIAEVQQARLALKKTSDSSVKQVAQTIIQGHTQANGELMQVAKAQHVMLPTQTDPTHKAIYAKLTTLSEPDFDRAYIAGQVKDHHKTVALFTKQAARTQDQGLKGFIGEALPDFKMHTKMLDQIHASQRSGMKTGMMKPGMNM